MKKKLVRVLVVDDDPSIREVLKIRLEHWGFEVRASVDAMGVDALVRDFDPQIVISDVVMPGVSGIDFLRTLMESPTSRAVILMTGHATVDVAVEAMKEGARDFLTKPLDYSKLKAALDVVKGELRLQQKSELISSQLKKGSGFGRFIGTSKSMGKVYKLMESLVQTDVSVLITGESGTGKELVARTLHERGNRSDRPFIAVNAAAVPAELMESEIFGHEKGAFTGATSLRHGCFEMADRGTLFLDEIAEMPVALQAKLLRVLEDGRLRRVGGKEEIDVDVRIVTATNRDRAEAIRQGQLREDLYYRLNVFTVHLPPLRERKTDIPLLAQHFISECNAKHRTDVRGLRDEVMDRLASYGWPGNVRELRNVIERAVVLSQTRWIEIVHLPPFLQNPSHPLQKIVLSAGTSAADAERELILRTLDETGNNKAEAARRLGVDVKTIRNKLKSYGLM
jgi:DNA-binding NtrC family response regulator